MRSVFRDLNKYPVSNSVSRVNLIEKKTVEGEIFLALLDYCRVPVQDVHFAFILRYVAIIIPTL